jgi:hypothetical protein
VGLLSRLVSVSPSRPSVIFHMAYLRVPFYLQPYIIYSLTDAPTADGCELATFADDTAIFVSNSEPMNVCDGLQSQLNSLTDYFKQWKIKVNASKTQAIYFTRCRSPRILPSTRIVLDGQEVFTSQISGSDPRHETDICVSHGQVNRERREGFANSLLVSQLKIETMFVQ